MATVEREVKASPQQVFKVLGDGWLYALWVVGATHIRDVDAEWPAPGTKIHHSVGVWPFLVHDETEVLEASAPGRLVLSTKARPVGVATVTILVSVTAIGSVITMNELPTSGPALRLHNRVQDRLLALRNQQSLARLADVAENRR